MRVACIQMRSGTDPEANARAFENGVREAAAGGATYIQTPEMTGLLQRNPAALLAAIRPAEEDLVLGAASRLASALRVWIHVGSTAIRRAETDSDRKAANRGAVFAPDGRCVATYDKIHMFDVAVDEENRWQESRRYAPGDQAVIVEADGFSLGLSICYDLRFPHLYRYLAKAGANILTCPSCFTKPTGKAHWETLLRARAIENGAFMIAAAQGGVHEDGRETHGHSMIVDPWGRVVAELKNDAPGVLIADIDLSAVEKARKRVPSLSNDCNFRVKSVNATISCGDDAALKGA